MCSKKPAVLKSLTFGKNTIHDRTNDSECQTDVEQPSRSTSDLSIFAKYLELLQGVGTGDGFELQGFPNVLSVQKLLLQQSHQSHIQYTGAEAEDACIREQKPEQSQMLNNNDLIKLNSFKKPSKFEECDSIIQHWHSHFPTSKLQQYFANEKLNINKKVLLAATQGLMADSELLSCDFVDMKWTFFLEGALAQATTADVLKCHNSASIDSMKNLLRDFNNSRVNAIVQNRTIIATTKKHQLLLEKSIRRMSRLSRRVSVILDIREKRHCFSLPNFSIVQLPRSPQPTMRKSYQMYYKGLRINIFPMPNQENIVQVENNGYNNSAIVLALEPLLHAGPDELRILHMRDLDSFFELKRQCSSIAV